MLAVLGVLLPLYTLAPLECVSHCDTAGSTLDLDSFPNIVQEDEFSLTYPSEQLELYRLPYVAHSNNV